MSQDTVAIRLFQYDEYEMSILTVQDDTAYIGNFWDFHAGSTGTTVYGYDLSARWNRGDVSLMSALAETMRENGQNVESTRYRIDDEDIFNGLWIGGVSPSATVAALRGA